MGFRGGVRVSVREPSRGPLFTWSFTDQKKVNLP